MTTASFATRLRKGERLTGYWAMLDSPASTERLARLGYDYICFDGQHGLMGYSGLLHGLMAVDAGAAIGGSGTVGIVRTAANNAAEIGRALDAGARGVIVPLINSAEEAAQAVKAVRYSPQGNRSYGPMRSALRVGPTPADSNQEVVCIVMIETPEGLANVREIAAVPGIDGLYVGPSDLTISVGGSSPFDTSVKDKFDAALVAIKEAAKAAGIAVGCHTPSGAVAAQRLAEGFNFVSIASDITHLEQIATKHLADSRV